ncbi:MAG: adenylyl-sulfate kinase [Chitinophagales bacterium]|jgi:adenylylsulfate kinase|nr:adenylyl-sulfate kinase [Chitinophagales bacterium]|tara:strand:+ start:4878 stop:5477 length:600 start_codon:yes stop_codon:yes gene_type:complete
MPDNIHPIFDQLVSREEKESFLNQHSKLIWLTGLSGSGKSTIAKGLEKALFKRGFYVQVLDGDNIRTGICNNLGFTVEDRSENIRRISEVGKLFIEAGVVTICSFVSPTQQIRKIAQHIIGDDDHVGVFIDAPIEICEKRDVKGLYKKARAGEIKNFTGIDSPFERPDNPNLIIETADQTIEESVEQVLQFVLPLITKK